jgi:hypothetical protein
MEAIFEKSKGILIWWCTEHDSDMEYDKIIFGGVDVLIGTPNKLGEMFTTAGFNVNRLKMLLLMTQILF